MAYEFDPTDGTTDALATPALAGTPAGDFACLIVFYRGRDLGSTAEFLVSNDSFTANNSSNVRINDNGFQMYWEDGSGNSLNNQAGIPAVDEWSVGILNFDFGTLTGRLYLNGTEVDSAVVAGWTGTDTDAYTVGAFSTGLTGPFMGAIADFAQWSRQLTPQEIADLSDVESGIRAHDLTTDLDWLYEMESLNDYQGSNAMTVTSGTPTLVEGPFSSGGESSVHDAQEDIAEAGDEWNTNIVTSSTSVHDAWTEGAEVAEGFSTLELFLSDDEAARGGDEWVANVAQAGGISDDSIEDGALLGDSFVATAAVAVLLDESALADDPWGVAQFPPAPGNGAQRMHIRTGLGI